MPTSEKRIIIVDALNEGFVVTASGKKIAIPSHEALKAYINKSMQNLAMPMSSPTKVGDRFELTLELEINPPKDTQA